jgi:hypothetical protein
MVLGGKKLFFSLYPPGPPKQAQRLRRTFALKQKDFSRKSYVSITPIFFLKVLEKAQKLSDPLQT